MGDTQSNGSEVFSFAGISRNFTLGDFWRWYATHLKSNITRGHLAEFIVAHALGIHESGPLPEWESHDLVFNDKRLEIKASAYIQAWDQTVNTSPRFSIRPTRKWDNAIGAHSDRAQRNSDMYIFCVLAETDRSAVNPLLLDKWEFYPVLTSELDATLGAQKSVGMGTICRMCPEPFDYASLREAVVGLFENRGDVIAKVEDLLLVGAPGDTRLRIRMLSPMEEIFNYLDDHF